jgi:hypothetical protein
MSQVPRTLVPVSTPVLIHVRIVVGAIPVSSATSESLYDFRGNSLLANTKNSQREECRFQRHSDWLSSWSVFVVAFYSSVAVLLIPTSKLNLERCE